MTMTVSADTAVPTGAERRRSAVDITQVVVVHAGWCLVHHALIDHMALMATALAAVALQLDGGRNLQAWQAAGLDKFWRRFGENLNSHHAHEEDFFFPWMATKMQMPQRMTDDHKVPAACQFAAESWFLSNKPLKDHLFYGHDIT